MANDTIKRLGLWALERFLPKENALEQHIRNIAKGFMLMVMGGLIVTSVFIGGLIGLHQVLTNQGLHPGFAVSIIGFIALLSAYICFNKADRILKDIIPDRKEGFTSRGLPSVRVDVALQDGLNVALSSFIKGLRGKTAEAPKQKDLFDELPDDEEDVIHFRPRERLER